MLPSHIRKMLPVRQVQFWDACSQLPAQGKRHQVESTAPGGRAGFTSGVVKVSNPPERGAPKPLLTCPERAEDDTDGLRTCFGPMQVERVGMAKRSLSPPRKDTGCPDKEQGTGGRARYHWICFVGRSFGLQRKWIAGRGTGGVGRKRGQKNAGPEKQ